MGENINTHETGWARIIVNDTVVQSGAQRLSREHVGQPAGFYTCGVRDGSPW